MDVQMMSSKGSSSSKFLFEHPMDVQMMSSNWSSATYLSVATIFEHPMDVQKMSSKWSSTSSYLTDTKPVWTPHGRPKDVLKMIVYLFLFDWHNTCLNTPWTSKWCPQRDPLQVPIWVSQPYLNTPWTCNRCPQSDRLPVPIWLTQHLLEHPMNVQKMSSKWSSTSSYLTDTQHGRPIWTPHGRGRPNDVLKGILYKFLFECPNPIWTPHGRAKDVLKGIVYQSYLTDTNLLEHPMNVQKMSSKRSSTSSYLTDTKPVWTPQGRAKDVLKGIVYQFLFDWHNTCLNTPWTSKWCPQRDPLQVPIWVSQPYLNTPWTCNRCPQSDRLPVPIRLTQHLLEHPMNVQKMSSKWSSTSSYLTTRFDWHNTCLNTPWTSKRCPQNVLKVIEHLPVPIWLTQHLFEHPMDVQMMSSKGSSTSSYLTVHNSPVWTPHGRPKDVLKDRLPVPIWLTQHLLEHPMNVQKMSSKWSSTSSYLSVPTLFEHPMDVQKMSSKWSSTSSYLTDTTPAWTPHERPKDVLKMWSSTSSYLTDTTPVWTPHGRPNDVLKGILYKFQFGCSKPIRTPHGRANDVLKLIVCQSYLSVPTIFEHPWTCKRCPQSDRLPVPIWLTQNQFEHHMDVQKMSSKWSSTCSYLTDTTPVWTPHGRPNDVLKVILYKFLFECPNPIWTPLGRAEYVLKVIVYQFLFDCHNICLNTPWTPKRCPQNDRLQVPIWLTQNLFEHPMDVQKMSSKGSSTSSYLTDTTPVWTPHGRPNDVLKGILYKFPFECSYLNTPWTCKWCPQIDRLPVPIFEHPMDVQKMSSKWSSTISSTNPVPIWSPLFDWHNTNLFEHPIGTPHGRAKDVLKVIVYQFLFDWHNICLNTPWTSKRCPQNDRLPVPIWLTQTQFEHPKDVQKMSSKGSSTSSYLTDTTPVWTPHGRPNDVLKGILYNNLGVPILRCPQIDRLPVLFECPNHTHRMDVQKMSSKRSSKVPIWWHKTSLNTTWTSKRCPQNDRLPVPIWLTQHMFEHPMDVQMMSSKWSSTSSYLSVTTLFEHPMDVQMMSSKWSSTSSYLTDTTPVWTPHGRPKDVLKMIVYQFLFDWHKTSLNTPRTCKRCLKGIVYQFLFDWHNTCLNTPWTSKWCPQRDPLQVPIWVFQPYSNTPWTCKWCPQIDRLPVLFECRNHIWTPHGRAKDVLKAIVYQFLFDWHKTSLNTTWTSKRCPQNDRLPVPIWLTQHMFEYPMDVQMMSSKWSSTSSYLSVPTLFEHPMDVQQMSSKWSSTSSY